MARLPRLLHLLAAVAVIAALAAVLAVAAVLPTPESRAVIAWLTARVLLPALLAMLVTGLLLVALRPAWFEQGWVWAKGTLAMGVVGIALVRMQPAARTAEQFVAVTAPGEKQSTLLKAALDAEWTGGWAAISLSLAAVVLAVWRPRFRRG